MESELKPCPFCGGIAAALDIRVVCENCGASTSRYRSPETAARKWNNRALDERDAEIERLRDEAADYGHAMLLRFDESAAKSTDLPTYISYLLHENARMKSRLQLAASPHESVGAVIRGHEQTIARLRAVLEWASERSGPSGRGMIAGLCLGEIQDATEAALRGDWPAVRAAGVVLPGEEG